MYTVNENPYLEIQIPSKCTDEYKSNIELFLKCEDFEVIKLDVIDDNTKDSIIPWIEKFGEKTFLLPNRLLGEVFSANVLFYEELTLCYYKKLNLQRCDRCHLVFLNYIGESEVDSELLNLISKVCMGKKVFLIIKNTEKLTLKVFKCVVDKLVNSGICITFNTLYKSTNTIMEHPCNAYMCSRQKCHSNKSEFPRFLHITEKGVMPYMAENEIYRFFGDISTRVYEDISYEFENYKKCKGHEVFVAANRLIYKQYVLSHILEILPWNYMLDLISREEL